MTSDSLPLDGRPRFELVKEKDSDRWKIQLTNFKKFQDVLGRDVLNAFCRCFIHSDRLTSMISFAYVSEQHHGRESLAFGRDLHTMVWFTIGTLRELARAVKDLRSALAKRKILDPDSPPWVTLRDVERRWEDDPFFRRMRDVAAFHIDAGVIDRGLDELAGDPHVTFSEGSGVRAVESSLTLGHEAQLNGLGMTPKTYNELVAQVSEDHGIGPAIQEAFILASQAAGIGFGDGDND